jgi:hypothetical protein
MTPIGSSKRRIGAMSEEEGQRRLIAAAIMRDRPQWLVIYGVYSRKFWAYALFSMTHRRVVQAAYPDALVERMDRTEQSYRVRPEER